METKTVKVRFTSSKRDGKPISFLTSTKLGELRCVREDDKCRKAIVLATPEVQAEIIPGVQYEAEISQMKNGARGYVATKITPVTYAASIETVYVVKCLYQIKVTWGNQVVLFDPKDGRTPRVFDRQNIISHLKSRIDIANLDKIIYDFSVKSSDILKKLDFDGFNLLIQR